MKSPTVSVMNPADEDAAAQTIVLAAKIRAIMDGRVNVSYADIRSMALPALRHRIVLNFDAEANDVSANDIINRLVEAVPDTGL